MPAVSISDYVVGNEVPATTPSLLLPKTSCRLIDNLRTGAAQVHGSFMSVWAFDRFGEERFELIVAKRCLPFGNEGACLFWRQFVASTPPSALSPSFSRSATCPPAAVLQK